jgi:sec-independent protein translocase protein TatB
MNLGFGEMMFLFILGLLLFGPKKLPEIGRQLGKFMGDFKRASQEFQSQLQDEVRQLEEEAKKVAEPEILPPSGTTARGEYVPYPLEPNSGEHEGASPDAPVMPQPKESIQ